MKNETKNQTKQKGRKCYGVARKDGVSSTILGTYKTPQDAITTLDTDWNQIVELTVTRVFERETELKEVETEI